MQDLHKWKGVSPILALVGVLVMFMHSYTSVKSHKFNLNGLCHYYILWPWKSHVELLANNLLCNNSTTEWNFVY